MLQANGATWTVRRSLFPSTGAAERDSVHGNGQ